MIKIILPLLILIPLSIFAQNAEQDLENGVKIYNALQEYMASLDQLNKVTADVLNNIKKRVKDGSTLLEKAIESVMVKQYILMYNMGAIFLAGLGGDMYFGIGAAYNQLDGGNNTYWNKDNFKIDDAFLTNRKTNYFSFTMRLGISIGFGR